MKKVWSLSSARQKGQEKEAGPLIQSSHVPHAAQVMSTAKDSRMKMQITTLEFRSVRISAFQEFNVGVSVLQTARSAPSKTAIHHDFGKVSYEDLAALTTNFAHHFQKHGVTQTSTVGIVTQDLLVMLASLLATSLLGCRWVMAGTLKGYLSAVSITHLFDDGPDPNDRLENAIAIDGTWAAPPLGATRQSFEGYQNADDPWIITHTSGTSGVPKFVAISQRAMQLRSQAAMQYLQTASRVAGVFPISALPLIIRYVTALNNQIEIVHSQSTKLWADLRVDYIFGSVAQIQNIIGDTPITPKLPCVQMSGASAHDGLIRRLMASFEKVTSGYGSTESNQSLQNSYTLNEDGALVVHTELMENVEVQCVDEDGKTVPAGEEGTVRIRNPFLASGYLGDAERTRQVFRDGWFYPGDRARWNLDGTFTICGRENDQFNLGGSKINAALLDSVILSVEGVEDAITFMMPRDGAADRLTAFLSIKQPEERPRIIGDIKLALTRLGRVQFVPERFLMAEILPRNALGKPDRRACVQLVLQRKQDGRRS